MSPEFWAGELGEFRAISTADGGTSLTSTAKFIQFPALSNAGDGMKGHLFITPRNFASSAVVAKIAFNPWLTILKTTDGMITAPTDYSIAAQDSSTSTSVVLSSLNAIASGDWVLVGSHMQYRGASLDVDSANTTSSRTLTVAYWNGGSWIDYSLSYSVAWSTAFDADTTVTWTPVTQWRAVTFRELYPNLVIDRYFSDALLFWTRWSVNGALSGTVTLDHVLAANRSTTYGELISGQHLEEKLTYGFNGWGCIEALTNTGTANLVVNVATMRGSEF